MGMYKHSDPIADAAADKDRWQWGYLACFAVSLIVAYITPGV